MAEIKYNAIVWSVNTTNDANLVLKENEIGVAQTGAIYFGDGVSKLSELVAVIAGGTLKVGQIPDLSGAKITKINGTHSYGVDTIFDIDVIKGTDSLQEALIKLQNQLVATADRIAQLGTAEEPA